MCSLGIEPTTFALLTQCSNHWATGTLEEHNETNAHWGIFFRLFCKMQRNVAYISASVNIARRIPPGTCRAPLRSTLFMLYNSEWEPLQTIQRVRQRTERIIQTDSRTDSPAGLIKHLNRIDSKEWIIREWASLIAQRKVDSAFGINVSIFYLYWIKIKQREERRPQ